MVKKKNFLFNCIHKEQIKFLKKDEIIIIKNGKINLFKHYMRLLVDDYW